MNTLVVVKTPLQLLNAIEAKAHFNLGACVLVILITGRIDTKYFDSAVHEPDWEEVHYYDLRMRWLWPHSYSRRPFTKLNGLLSQWTTRTRFDRFFNRFRNVKYLVLGFYGQSHFLHIANLLPTATCIILDDGTESLRIANKRSSKAKSSRSATTKLKRISWQAKQVVTRHAHWMTQQRDALTFFSSYRLELPPQDRFVKNSYAVARRRAGTQKIDGRYLFLGQPLVEDGYLERGELESLLHAIKIELSPEEFVYVPHPREDQPLLQESLARLGIEIKLLDTSIEYFLIGSDTLPRGLAGFFSSALDNCRTIWGGRMRLVAFRIPEKSLIGCRAECEEIYSYLKNTCEGAIELRDVSPQRKC